MPLMAGRTTSGITIEVIEAPAATTETLRKLEALGHLPEGSVAAASRYTIVVNGTPLPLPALAYEIGQGEVGPVVTVSLPADRVVVGEQAGVSSSPARRAGRAWGGAGQVDPRAGIPGWGQQDEVFHG